MSLPVLPPYEAPFKPVPQVTPLTYRDGVTMLKKLDDLKKYINRVIVPFVNDNMKQLGDDFEEQVNILIAAVNAAIDSIINNSIEVQDPVVAGLVNDSESATSVALTAIYATIENMNALLEPINLSLEGIDTELEAIDAELTGRLSDNSLTNKIRTAVVNSTGLNVQDYGAVGDGIADDTVAIQNAVNALAPGQALIFPHTGSGAYYLISATINITTPSVRLIGQPRDAYSQSIRTNTASLLMISVKAPGFVMENLGLIGKTDLNGGWTNGNGCTAVGLELFGDVDGNVDAAIRGCTVQFMHTGIILHGRNTEISVNTVINNCRFGIKHNGIDVAYHTGPNADQNRGNVIRDCRFHNVGLSNTDNAIEFTSASKVLHLIIDGNHFDSGGVGKHIVITGTLEAPARGVSIINNKHTEVSAEVVTLTYCHYPLVSDFVVIGFSGVQIFDGIVLANCLYAIITNFVIRLVGRHGIYGTTNDSTLISNGKIIQVGMSSGVGNAITFDSTNSNVQVDNVQGATGDGYFFSGSPTGSANAMHNCTYTAFTLGGIDSLTIMNHSHRGVNRFTEGKVGRVEDEAYGFYELVAATPKAISTLQIGNNFGSVVVEIEISGRHSASGNAYYVSKKIIRNENGTPNIATVGTDATAGLTVTIAATGPQTLTITAECAVAVKIGAKVRMAAAGGGAGASVPVTVTMAALA